MMNLKPKILVIDDDPAMVDLIGFHLDSSNFHCIGCGSGKETLEKIDQESFDLLILDAVLGDTSGKKLSYEIRKRFPAEELPILLISAFFKGNHPQVKLLRDWQVQGFLPKPFSGQALRKKLEQTLGLCFPYLEPETNYANLQLAYLEYLEHTANEWVRILHMVSYDLKLPNLLIAMELKCHQIVGSAGCYRLDRVAKIAEHLETETRECRLANSKTISVHQKKLRFWLLQLLASIKQDIRKKEITMKDESSSPENLPIQPSPNREAEPKRILAVDDDRFALLMVKHSMKDRDWTIETLNDPNQLISFAKEWLPDLIILDAEMGDFSGYDLCRKLKQDPVLREVPVILLSGHTEEKFKTMAFEAGFSQYCTKEALQKQLPEQIQELLT